MFFKTLKLKNYRKFKDEFIEFPDGVIGIVGNNGAGKSTIIEAIGWALYGQHAARTEKDLIKRESALPNDNCSVELEFVLDGEEFLVKRELRGKNLTAGARVYLSGKKEPEAVGMNYVTDCIAKRIGMDYQSFFTSVFAKQKELNALSDLRPGKRKERVLRMLNIDRIDVAIAQIRADIRGKEEHIGIVRITLKDMHELKETLDELKDSEKGAKEQVGKLRGEKEKISEKLASAKKKRDVLEKKNRSYQRLSKKLDVSDTEKKSTVEQLNSNNKELEGLLKKRETLKKLEPKEEEYKKLKKQKRRLDILREKFLEKKRREERAKELEEENRKYAIEIKKVSKELKALKNIDKKLREVDVKIFELEDKREKINNKAINKKNEIKKYKEKIAELEEEKGKIKKLGQKSKCPTCEKVLGKDHKKIVAHFDQEIEKFTKKIKTASLLKQKLLKYLKVVKRDLSECKEIRKKIENQFQVRAGKEENLRGSKRKIKKNERDLREVSKKLKKIGEIKYSRREHELVKKKFDKLFKVHERIIELKNEVSRIPTIKKAVGKLNKKSGIVEESIKTLSKKITNLAFDEKEYKKVKRRYESISGEYHEKDKELIKMRDKRMSIRKDIKRAFGEIEEEKKKQKSIEAEEKKVQKLSKLERVMGDFRIHLISRIRPMLSSKAAELFRKLTDGKYTNMELDEDYEIHIQDEGKLFGLPRFSGGEEDLANLCLRIAISQVITERSGGTAINFIALDEIFGSQDTIRKSNVLKALNDLSSQFRQIMLITHVEDVKDSMPYSLNVYEDEDGISHVSVEGSPKIVY